MNKAETVNEVDNRVKALLHSWADEQRAIERWEKFLNMEHPPEVPKQIDGVHALARYNQECRVYGEHRQEHERVLRENRVQYERDKQRVLDMLPMDVPFIYDHTEYGAYPAGKRFRILKVNHDNPDLEIKELASE